MSDAALLAALPAWAFAFMLALARISGAVMLLPGFGEAAIPATVRAGLALVLTVLLLPGIAPLVPPVQPEGLRDLAMIGAELITGLWLGWLARLLVAALQMAGTIAAYMVGLSNVLQLDPELGAQTTIITRTFNLAAPVLILSSGLAAVPLDALAESYRLIAPGALLPAGDVAQSVVTAVSGSFALALRLAAPFVFAGIVWQILLGVLARLVPHLQVYFVAMPAQIVGGLVLLGLLGGPILLAWMEAVRTGYAALPGAL